MIAGFDEGGVTGAPITDASDSSILLDGVDFNTWPGSIMFDRENVDV
jgi:hypothetical protein